MLRRRSSSAVIALLLALWLPVSLVSQSGVTGRLFTAQVPAGSTVSSSALSTDTAVGELLRIHKDLTHRVVQSGTDRDKLRTALKTGDEEAAIAFLGFSAAEYAALDARLRELREEVLRRFPALGEITVQRRCGWCEAEGMAIDIRRHRGERSAVDQAFDLLERRLKLQSPEVRGLLPVIGESEAEPARGGGPSEPGVSRSTEMPSEGGLFSGGPGYPTCQEGDPSSCEWLPYVAALALCTLLGPIWYWVCAYVAYCSFCKGPLRDGLCDPLAD